MVSDLLDKAFSEVGKLPEPEQDSLAGWILFELDTAGRRQQALDSSEWLLDRLADEALAEHQRRQTEVLDPATL